MCVPSSDERKNANLIISRGCVKWWSGGLFPAGDGRGGLRIPAAHSKDFAGERLNIGGRSVGITTDGRANIPRKIMEEYGTRLPDGRYALAVDVGYRYTDGKLQIGGYINQGAAAPEDVQTGGGHNFIRACI